MFKLTKPINIFSLTSPLESENGEYTIALTNLEVYSSVSNLTEHNNIFTMYTLEALEERKTPELNGNLEKFIEQRNSSQIELHKEEVIKRG